MHRISCYIGPAQVTRAARMHTPIVRWSAIRGRPLPRRQPSPDTSTKQPRILRREAMATLPIGRRKKSSSRTSVVAALIGDLLVAASKIVAAAWTGSAAMTSEAMRSVVDTTNEILLLYGIHRSKQKSDADHPFGHGREIYFWSFVVSLLIFALGAGVAIYEGVSRILKPVPIESPIVSYIVLALAFIFEGGAWLVSLKQFREAKGELGFFDAFRISKDPPLFMTLFEDSVALIGILIAAASTFAAVALARPEIDGIGSVGIGLLLAVTSIFLARESKSLLMAEPAYPVVRRSILSIATCHPAS